MGYFVKEDIQEVLDAKLLKEEKDKNSKILSEILNRKEDKVDRENFIEQLTEILNKDKKKNKFQDKVAEANEESDTAKKQLEDEENELIFGTKQPEENEKQVEDPEIQNAEEVEVSEEELNEKYDEDLTLSQKKYAYMYEKMMKEYYRLKTELTRLNVRDGEISIDDRNFTKLMNLKRVAVKSEMYFRNSTGGKYIGDVIPEIADLEKDNELELSKYQKEINKSHEKYEDKVEDKKANIEKSANKIQELLEKIGNGENSSPELMEELHQEQERYFKYNQELEMMEPNSLKVAVEEERNLEQKEIEERKFGYIDERKIRKSDIYTDSQSISNLNKQRTVDAREEKINTDGVSNDVISIDETIVKTREKFEQEIQDAIDNHDTKLALELTDKYSEMVNDFNRADDKKIEENVTEYTEQISEQLQEQAEENIEEEIKEEPKIMPPPPPMEYPGLKDLPVSGPEHENPLGEQLHENSVVEPEKLAEVDSMDEDKLKQLEDIANGNKTEREPTREQEMSIGE